MPSFKRYWSDPEKHRAECRARVKRRIKEGFPGGMTNPARYLEALDYRRRWNRAHLKQNAEATERYRNRIRSLGFDMSDSGLFKYRLYLESKGKLRHPRKTRANIKWLP